MIRSFYEILSEFADELENKWFYVIFLLATCASAWYSYTLILNLPKPETLISTGLFYLQHVFPYLGMMGMAFVAFFFCATLAFSSIRIAYRNIREHILVSILVGLIGSTLSLLSVYFLAYGMWLLFVLGLIALFGKFWLDSNSSSGRKGYR